MLEVEIQPAQVVPEPTDEAVILAIANDWYVEGLAATPPVGEEALRLFNAGREQPVGAEEALRLYTAGREQTIGAIALAWKYNRNIPHHEHMLQIKLARLESLGRGVQRLGIVERALAEETAIDTVLQTLGAAALDHTTRFAFHDPLTGAQNRNGETRLLKLWTQPTPARRRGEEAPRRPRRALLEVDMANFKRINDVLGDNLGDQVLIETVLELEDLTRGDGREVVRPGGDDFRLYINDITRSGLKKLLERVQAVQDAKVANGRNQALWMTIGLFKGFVERRGEVFRPSVEPRDPDDPESERMLCINGRRVAPLRHLLVYAIGGAHGQVSTARGYNAMRKKASGEMKEHKERLHEAMGGADRAHVEYVVNELPDEGQGSNIVIEQFGGGSGEPTDRYVIDLDHLDLSDEKPTILGSVTKVSRAESQEED